MSDEHPIPLKVLAAKRIKWGVIIDAYLTNAAKVATPPAMAVAEQQGFVLLQSLCGRDHYVVVSWLEADEASTHPCP